MVATYNIYILSRVNNKERKRVSNELYTPYEMFSESHAPGIKKSTNESARFKWYIVGVASSASQREAISTESASRSQYETSVREESSIKLMKGASILLNSKKNQLFSPWTGHVCTAASHVTCRKHITRGI